MTLKTIISTVSFLIILSLLFPTMSKANVAAQSGGTNKIVEVAQGYRMPDSPDPVVDVLPTLDVAYKVALPILQSRYNSSFENYEFQGYLANDSIWVIYGNLIQLVEGGGPYIELNKNDGRVVVITHTK